METDPAANLKAAKALVSAGWGLQILFSLREFKPTPVLGSSVNFET